MKLRLAIALALASLLGPRAGGAEPLNLTIRPNKSKIVARLFKDGIAARMAHDHVILAKGLTGTIRVDPARPASAQITVRLVARALRADSPQLRRRYGLTSGLGADDVAKINDNMRGPGQLHVDKYKVISFRSTGVTSLGGGRYRVEGDLRLRGVTRRVRLPVRASLRGGVFKGSGQLRLLQSWFGYAPYSAALGLVKLKDALTLDIYLEAAAAGATRR